MVCLEDVLKLSPLLLGLVVFFAAAANAASWLEPLQ